MTANELLEALSRANLVIAAGITLVLVLRGPWRNLFGSAAAYQLWALVPLAFAASWLPAASTPLTGAVQPIARGLAAAVQTRTAETAGKFLTGPQPAAEPLPLAAILLTVWTAGMALAFIGLAVRQRRFGRAAREGRGGPAVSGFLRPRIVTPKDFTTRFEPEERDVILAHEQVHLGRQDARINGVLELVQCLCWFNPLVWIGARYLRLDQELACDAAVVRRHPGARGPYASAMLKTQLQAAPLPIGCYWPARGAHPLTERIAMLKRPAPSPLRRGLALAALAAVTSVAGLAAWNTQSAQASPGRVGVAVMLPLVHQGPRGTSPGLDAGYLPPMPREGYQLEHPIVSVYARGIELGSDPVSLNDLPMEIRRQFPNIDDGYVLVRSWRETPYRDFLAMLNRLNDAGFTRIAVVPEDQ